MKLMALIKNNEFIEYTSVFNHMYGSLKSSIEDTLQEGKFPVIILDTVGKEKFVQIFPESVSFFIMPKNAEEIIQRLVDRSTSSTDIMLRTEAVKREIEDSKTFNYIFYNNSTLESIVDNFSKKLEELFNKEIERLEIETSINNFRAILDKSSQLEVFIIIEGLMFMLKKADYEYSKKGSNKELIESKVVEIKNSILLCIEFVKKFTGEVTLQEFFDKNVMGEVDKGQYLTPTKAYETWFIKWSSWKQTLTQEQWDIICEKLEKGEPIENLPA